jgi:ATP-dependent 26S proteasome regulatory subunit
VITADQVVLLEHYFKLARFLQPSIIVVEDVDLIARERTQLRGSGQEMLLNKLLNEMDGLREDAEIIFILTTNRPDQLEPALASRPGRSDQAIEFPLPDDIGRPSWRASMAADWNWMTRERLCQRARESVQHSSKS